jgi:hypothetical protein
MDEIELDKLPDGPMQPPGSKPSGTIDGFFGLLAGKTNKVATLDEITEATEAGWAGQE